MSRRKLEPGRMTDDQLINFVITTLRTFDLRDVSWSISDRQNRILNAVQALDEIRERLSQQTLFGSQAKRGS